MISKNKYRTVDCGSLRIADVGREETLSGFVDTIRKLGGITFVVLRDYYGKTQIILPETLQIELNKEDTICVHGKVAERTSKNPNMETGDIEVVADKVEILGKCQNVLPFEIKASQEVNEDLRLKYRYLDLRAEYNQKMLKLRSDLMLYVRNYMQNLGFLEVQTPILTASSPEGARDFLVPSRLNPGKFYALPQAPQQFKQLLMTNISKLHHVLETKMPVQTVLQQSFTKLIWKWLLRLRKMFLPLWKVFMQVFLKNLQAKDHKHLSEE